MVAKRGHTEVRVSPSSIEPQSHPNSLLMQLNTHDTAPPSGISDASDSSDSDTGSYQSSDGALHALLNLGLNSHTMPLSALADSETDSDAASLRNILQSTAALPSRAGVSRRPPPQPDARHLAKALKTEHATNAHLAHTAENLRHTISQLQARLSAAEGLKSRVDSSDKAAAAVRLKMKEVSYTNQKLTSEISRLKVRSGEDRSIHTPTWCIAKS